MYPILKPSVDTILQRAVEAGDIPGVAAMACTRDATIYEGAFGTRKLGANNPMATDSVVWIASMTKPITSAGVMQLVEQGKIALDDDMSRWVPELSSVEVLEGFDTAGAPRLRAPKRPITLRHLLTHTSGYGYGVWNEPIARYMEVTGLPATSSCQNVALRLPLLFDPGECWNYGINIELVGKVIESVSGKKLGVYLKENLLDPLGMDSTGFRITPSMRNRMARLHERRTHCGRLRSAAGAGIRTGRWRAVFDRDRLPCLRAHDPEHGHGQQQPRAQGGNG
jgi:CubicO group peptidase (beta-lactamase class C family)